jgi:glutamate/aspartate transport system substrate-binding protein
MGLCTARTRTACLDCIEEFVMKFALSMVALAAALFGTAAGAEALDEIKANSTLRMGVRSDTGGLSYVIADEQYGGFHHELCQRVVKDLEKQLDRPLDVVLVRVNAQSRIPSVANGTVDMECGATTNNLTRQQHVAFAVTTYVEEVRVAVRANSGIQSVAQLNGKSVATTSGTTSLPLLRKHRRGTDANIQEIVARTDAESFALMATGKVDAFVMDGQILASLISGSQNPADFRLLGDVLSVEPIAIMLPKNSPALKKAVDNSLKAMMASGEIEKIYKKWFLEPLPPHQKKIGLAVSDATRKAWAEPNDRPVEKY